MKRLLDILASFFGFLLLSPLFLVIAIWIKFSSKGPVFYNGKRVGKDGEMFKMFKFRSMVDDADKKGGPSTAEDDLRLTNVGKFLKKYQLDEFPQLINILKGEMSLVGPRPEVKIYVDMMTEEQRKKILSVRPGMTDLASLWNFHEGEVLRGAEDPEKAYMEKIRPKKLELQMEYIEKKSFLLDLKIIFKTILKIFK